MTVLRRFIVFAAVMFWQGGFTFYGAVVVPVGAAVLGSHREQGFVTRVVTNYLNAAGAVALVVWCWDVAAADLKPPKRRRLGWLLLLALLAMLVGLAWLHVWLDELLDLEESTILAPRAFRRLHRIYLILSTVQWFIALWMAGWTIHVWREQDAAQTVDKRNRAEPAGAAAGC